jgi:hypothetical protein
VFALLVTNVGDGFPSLRDGRRSRARHAQAGDVGAQRGCPTWVPNVLVRNVGDGRPSLGDGRPSRARPADTHLCFPWVDAHTDQARYCSSPLTATVCHSTVEERLPGMGKVAGSNPAGTHFRFFVQRRFRNRCAGAHLSNTCQTGILRRRCQQVHRRVPKNQKAGGVANLCQWKQS